ncbi:MAG: Alpha/Beta hydrolase protein [Monoraphidium minutum]|nr:MAG: Alpha/Beta hydrolase protein [Monoraphidium minutum]
MAPLIIGSLVVAPGTRIAPRPLLPRLAVGGPILTAAGLGVLTVLARRLGGLRGHPLGWDVHEEITITLIRTFMTLGDIGVWRAMFRNLAAPLPPALRAAPAGRPGSKSLWYELAPALRPAAPRAALDILFIHGGAFMSGGCTQYQATYQWWLEELAARGIAGRILTVSYPLAPEHPYPEGRDTCVEEIAWFLEQCGDTPAVVGGDSAGGNLVLSALARLRDGGRLPAPPRALLLVSPCVDMSGSSVFSQPRSEGGRYDYLPKEKLNEGIPHFYTHDLTCPYVSPTLLESLAGLADREALIINGGEEIMAPDIRSFAKKLSAAAAAPGCALRVAHHEEPGRVHSWPMLPLPSLKARQGFLFEFFARAAGAGAAAAE